VERLSQVALHKIVTGQQSPNDQVCRNDIWLDGYVCKDQQGEIERMHSPPGKRISMEILVGVEVQA